MENPFEEISQRLLRIESMLIRIREESGAEQKSGDDVLLGIQEAADFLQEAKATIYSRTSRREIPFYKRGKKIYFKKKELMAWVESGKKKTDKELFYNRDHWIEPLYFSSFNYILLTLFYLLISFFGNYPSIISLETFFNKMC